MIKLAVISEKIKFLLLIIIYYSLMVHYGHYIEARFDRVIGFSVIEFNFFYYLLNLIPVICYSFLFPLNLKYTSDYLVLFILLFVNIPIGYFCLLKINSYFFSFLFVLLNFSWFLIWLFLRNTFFVYPKKIPVFNIKNIVIFSIFLSVFYFLISNGIGFKFFEKREIYRIRKLFKSQDIGLILSYLFSLMQYSIIPLILMIAIRLKSYILKVSAIILAIICAFSIFSVTALKSSLFVLVFVLIGYIIAKKEINKSSKFLIFLNAIVVFLTLFSNYNPIFTEFYNHTLRRVFYSPIKTGVLAYDYFLYHCNNCGFSKGIGDNVGHTISKFYFNLEGNSTTGFLANSLLNKGIFNTFFSIIMLIIIFKLIDSVTKNTNIKYGLVVFIVFGYVLSNTALTSTLLSYGLLLSIITFKFLSKWLQNKK